MAKRRARISDGAGWERDSDEPGVRRKMRFQKLIAAAIQRDFRRKARAVRDLLMRTPQAVKADAWEDELLRLMDSDELEREIVRLFGGAAIDGVALFGEAVGVAVDLSAVNVEAATWARKYVGKLIKGIDATTRDTVRKAIAYYVTTPGATLGDVMGLMPFDTMRARRIATTEITRAYAEGNQFGADALAEQFPGLRVMRRWWTNRDDRVCPICAPLHGAEAAGDEPFPAENDDGPIMNPPAHVNCRCWTSYNTEAAE